MPYGATCIHLRTEGTERRQKNVSVQQYENVDRSTQTYFMWDWFTAQSDRLGGDSPGRLVLRWLMGDVGASYSMSTKNKKRKTPTDSESGKSNNHLVLIIDACLVSWYITTFYI